MVHKISTAEAFDIICVYHIVIVKNLLKYIGFVIINSILIIFSILWSPIYLIRLIFKFTSIVKRV